MDTEEYFKLMQLLKKLSKHGWICIYGFNNGRTVRELSHVKHGTHRFDTWFKLKAFAEKQNKLIG